MRAAQAGGRDVLGPFVVTGTYPGDGGGGTGPVLPPVPNLQLTPPSPTGWGFALGYGVQAGASWVPPFIVGGNAGFYVDVGEGSFGFYVGGSESIGLGGVLSAGPQGSFFSSLDAFRGEGVGGEFIFGPGVSLTTPLGTPGSGYVFSADSPVGGAGGGIYTGAVGTTTRIYEWINW